MRVWSFSSFCGHLSWTSSKVIHIRLSTYRLAEHHTYSFDYIDYYIENYDLSYVIRNPYHLDDSLLT